MAKNTTPPVTAAPEKQSQAALIKAYQAVVFDSVGKPISKKEIESAQNMALSRDPNGGTELLYAIFREWGYTVNA